MRRHTAARGSAGNGTKGNGRRPPKSRHRLRRGPQGTSAARAPDAERARVSEAAEPRKHGMSARKAARARARAEHARAGRAAAIEAHLCRRAPGERGEGLRRDDRSARERAKAKSRAHTSRARARGRASQQPARTHTPHARSGTRARTLLCKCTGRKAARTRAHAPSHLSVEHLSAMCESVTTRSWRAKVAQLAFTRQEGESHRCAPLGSLWSRHTLSRINAWRRRRSMKAVVGAQSAGRVPPRVGVFLAAGTLCALHAKATALVHSVP